MDVTGKRRRTLTKKMQEKPVSPPTQKEESGKLNCFFFKYRLHVIGMLETGKREKTYLYYSLIRMVLSVQDRGIFNRGLQYFFLLLYKLIGLY